MATLSPALRMDPNAVNKYGMNMALYKKYFGKAKIVSREGSVDLEASRFIENHYGYILAKTGFNSLSTGMIINHTGYIHSSGTEPSYIKALGLYEHCDERYWMLFRDPNPHVGWHQHLPYDSSEKPVIYSGGDLHLGMTPVIEGGDIFAGGNLICSTPTSGFYTSNVGNNISRIAAGKHIIVNGSAIAIKASLFIAGLGISLTSSGSIVITNPDGHQSVIPSHSTVDVSLSSLVQSMYPALLRHNTSSAIVRSIPFLPDPTTDMKRLFFGRLPDPNKKLVFNPYIMGSISMVIGSMLNVLGTKATDTKKFLALLEGNAEDLPDSLVPISSTSGKSFIYFKLKDIDKETQEADPYLRISADILRYAITSNVGIISEHGPIEMRAANILTDRALIEGTSVEMISHKSPDASPVSGKISLLASTIQAIDKDNGHILLNADNGVFTNAKITKQAHFYGGGDNWSRIETVKSIDHTTLEAPKAIAIVGGASEIRGTLVKTKTFLDQTSHLLIGVNKERLNYESHAKKRRWYGSSSIDHYGYHEIAVPSVISVKEMLSNHGNSLIFESVIAENLEKLHIQKPVFREQTAVLHSHDEVHTSSGGLCGLFGGFSITDPLAGAWQSVLNSPNSKAMISAAISAAANTAGSIDDATKLFEAVVSGINFDSAAFIAGTLAKRMVNFGFSFSTQRTTTVSDQTRRIPNRVSAELIHLECPTAVHLEGHHVARDLIIETESFTTSDMKNSTKIESHTSGRTIGMNLMSAVVGAAMSMMTSTATASPAMSSMLGSAASVSNTSVNQTMRQVVHEPTTVVADRFILRAGSAHLTDTQIRARLVDAIIRKDLVIQSIADEFFSESNGGGFSAGLGFLGLVQGVRNMTDLAASMGGIGAHVVDVEEIDRRVNNFASLVGEEQFNLVVGGTLLAQSAFYGRKEHGEKVSSPRKEVPIASTASEHIKAGRIQHEIVPEEHSFENESFNIPLGDLISLVSTLTPKEELAKAVADDVKAQGKSNQEAMEAAKETKAIVVVSEAARRKVATRKKAAVAKVRHALLEKAPEVAAQSFRMDDDAFIAFVEQYACEHPNDSIAREWSIASMILAQEQRAIYLEAARQFEALPLSERAKRYAEVARDAALEYADEFSADPLTHTKDLAGNLGYFVLDMAVPGGINPAVQWWNGEMSGNQATALWGVALTTDITTVKVGKVVSKFGKSAVKAVTRGTERLTARVIEKIAQKKQFVTREQRWIQLAESGRLPKEMVEVIKKNKGRNIYDIFGYELAHRPGKPAFRGFDFSDALPKTKSIHRNQHRFYTDLEKGGFVLHKPPRADNFWTHPKIGVFKKLDQVEKHVKGKQ